MMVLDTDHISILEHADSLQAVALAERLSALPEDEVASTAVTLEEQAPCPLFLFIIERFKGRL